MEVCCERRSAFFHDPSATFNLSPWNILQTHMLIQLIISVFFSVRVCLCHRSRSISGASSGLSTSPLSSPRVSQSCKMFSCSATVTITVQSITDILLPFTDTLAWENCNVVHHQYFTTTSDMHLATDTDIVFYCIFKPNKICDKNWPFNNFNMFLYHIGHNKWHHFISTQCNLNSLTTIFRWDMIYQYCGIDSHITCIQCNMLFISGFVWLLTSFADFHAYKALYFCAFGLLLFLGFFFSGFWQSSDTIRLRACFRKSPFASRAGSLHLTLPSQLTCKALRLARILRQASNIT